MIYTSDMQEYPGLQAMSKSDTSLRILGVVGLWNVSVFKEVFGFYLWCSWASKAKRDVILVKILKYLI